MSDRLNPELLSAYLDNEVTEEERAQVEQALVASPETRRSLEELRQVQARLQSVPRMSLPDDFHERVVQEATRREATQPVSARPSGTGRWMRISAVATTVAALLLIAILVAIQQRDSEVVENSDPDGTNVVQQLPGNDVVAVALNRPKPELILVFDLAITEKGRQDDVFGKALKKSGISFDPRQAGVSLDAKLRNNLLKTRIAAGVGQQEPDNRDVEFDVVDMVYVQGTGIQFDEIYSSMSQSPEVLAVLDVAMKPDAQRVLNSIGERSWSLAVADSKEPPNSYAYRLNIGISLHSDRSGFLARFPTPGLNVRVIENDNDNDKSGSMSGFNVPIPFDFGGKQRKPGEVDDNPDDVNHVPIYEILVIRRNLKGGFPGNAEQPDAN